MSKTEYIKAQIKISSLGLSKYESKAYLTLLLFNRLSAQELAELSQIPKTKIYQICEKLNEKGLVKIETELEKIYIAKNPNEAIKNLIKWKSLNQAKKLIKLKETIKKIKGIHPKDKLISTKNPLLTYYIGVEQVEKKLFSLEKEKQKITLFISQKTSPLVKIAHFKNITKIICCKSVANSLKVEAKVDIVPSVPLDIALVGEILYVPNFSDTSTILWEFFNPTILEFFNMGIKEMKRLSIKKEQNKN